MESSPPFNMCGTDCLCRPRSQHLPTRPGSHQHLSAEAPPGQAETLRHFRTSSSNVGRCFRLMMAFIVPGLDTKSMGSAEVSTIPGRARAMSCHSKLCFGMPEPKRLEIRLYWLPTSALMFAHFG